MSPEFEQENPDRPLVFHTLPPKENQTADRAYDDNNDNIRRVDKKSAIPRATHSITQLISVVEIIKRTYAAWALAQKGADGRHAEPALRTGLHQYNELCTLESLGIVTKEDEAVKLKQILGGGHWWVSYQVIETKRSISDLVYGNSGLTSG